MAAAIIDGANNIRDMFSNLVARARYDQQRRNRETFEYFVNNDFIAKLKRQNTPPYCVALFAAAVHSSYELLVEVDQPKSVTEVVEDLVTKIKKAFEDYKSKTSYENLMRGAEASDHVSFFAEELANKIIMTRVNHVYSGSGNFLYLAKDVLSAAIYNVIIHGDRALNTIMSEVEWYAQDIILHEAKKLSMAVGGYDSVGEDEEN